MGTRCYETLLAGGDVVVSDVAVSVFEGLDVQENVQQGQFNAGDLDVDSVGAFIVYGRQEM